MLRVLLVTSDFPPAFGGGISRYYHAVAQNLADRVVVLAPSHGEARLFDSAQPFSVYRCRAPVGRAWVFRLAQIFLLGVNAVIASKRVGADFILWGHWYLVMAAPIVRLVTGRPFGVCLHGGELSRFRRFPALRHIIVVILNWAKFLVVNSEYTRQEYVGLGVMESRLHKVSPGVDVERFAPSISPHSVIEKQGLSGRQVLLTVGRLVERKGHDRVITAMPAILEKVPQAVYLIAGTGPQEAYLRSLVREVGVADRVVFAGHISEEELPAYYNACDVFVMPSRQVEGRESVEGFGIVYLEANACGKPTVGGNSGGVAEAVRDGITGVLVDPADLRAVADAVIHLLLDSNFAQRLGRQGREIVEREFSWHIQAQRLQGLLAGWQK